MLLTVRVGRLENIFKTIMNRPLTARGTYGRQDFHGGAVLRRLPRLALELSVVVVGLCFCRVGFGGVAPNQHFEALKEFLDSDPDEYEVVFSILHQSSEGLLQIFAELKPQFGSSTKLVLDQEIYYRVRCARDGFFIQQAKTLQDLKEGNADIPGSGAHGTVSNANWSVNPELLTWYLTKMSAFSVFWRQEPSRIA
jgi:hypothetical protein